jgi:2-oxoglutarate dehydrogenase E1 component
MNEEKKTQRSSLRGIETNRVFDEFRRWGYLQAKLDPLGDYLRPSPVPELDVIGEVPDEARKIYCGTIGIEFMHIANHTRRQWLQERLEGEAPIDDHPRILELLIRAEIFEQVLQSRYPGTKRFSLEGSTALIPLLDTLLHSAIDRGVRQTVLAMSHRGRLNVMANIVGTPLTAIFAKFEEIDPRSVLGSGDVKYHIGATGEWRDRGGNEIHAHLVSNPSHLEAVNSVAMGRARAKQTRFGSGGEDRVFPVFIHGDAAFAGQGTCAEALNLASLNGYSIGGCVHIIVNNLIGFTASPDESNSSRYVSDLAKRLPVPIFHVNGEDLHAVVLVARLAAEYRYSFHCDVVVDLVGYRRYGHSEVDDPTITQPLRYAKIKDHPPLHAIYAEQIGVDPSPQATEIRNWMAQEQAKASRIKKPPALATLPKYWGAYHGGPYLSEDEPETGITLEQIHQISQKLTSCTANFHVHPKIKKLLEQRAEMGRGRRPMDFGMAEACALGTLVLAGVPVRLSGQDSKRGTFNQRHSVLVDVQTEEPYIPLANLSPDQARFEVYNSILSEAAVLGFEYGFSRDYPEALVLWEAQFGDFANGAQIVIDQFIAAGEDKWGLLSGLVLLLPHGYEGQGPEHSSARLERFLQLAAHDNMQICQPSTAAQYFHLLRRQALQSWRKPLIALTPKSMLRHPDAASLLPDFASPRFQKVLPDPHVQQPERLLLCTGKIGHELRAERARRHDKTTGIVFLEQLYPWPEKEIAEVLKRYSQAHEVVWVQEEPANMGALSFVVPRLRRLAHGRQVRSVKRSAASSPATGSAKAHSLEQKTLLTAAFGGMVTHPRSSARASFTPQPD